MRMILGLDVPTQGLVAVCGRSYRDLSAPMREVGALLDAKALRTSGHGFRAGLAVRPAWLAAGSGA
jgi:ABC-2 type transport system ATP-binding protein